LSRSMIPFWGLNKLDLHFSYSRRMSSWLLNVAT
jgi:hypothetical protein